ncbi:MAG TPA: ATP-binding protein, partial [Actinomycetales bacterium]
MTAELVLPGLWAEHLTGRKTDGQWRLRRLQVVNWGGFDGHHILEIDAHSTLLSGQSGTGKSTLLDAYTALMMDSNVPYNGASNSSGSGRARSGEQRNNLTYVRGLTDVGRDAESDTRKQNFLRGADAATWSAVAATFQHDDGDRHTALRLFYAPANADNSNQIGITFAQAAGDLDLRTLETYAVDRFNHRRIKANLPAMVFDASYTQWAGRLFTRLSIGRKDDGSPAMKLLSRIQAGRTINSVDALFKDMVLEAPRTYT